MSKLQALIEEIEVNAATIAELEVKAKPFTEEQHAHAVVAKAARADGRACQVEIDKFLAPAQVLRKKNQDLKLEAGVIAVNEATSAKA